MKQPPTAPILHNVSDVGDDCFRFKALLAILAGQPAGGSYERDFRWGPEPFLRNGENLFAQEGSNGQ